MSETADWTTPGDGAVGQHWRGAFEDGVKPARIALWGATGSGKTMFLWALPQAIHHHTDTSRHWTVSGSNDEGRRFLRTASILVRNGELPLTTDAPAPGLGLQLRGERKSTRRLTRVAPKLAARATTKIQLDLADFPGWAFETESAHEPDGGAHRAAPRAAFAPVPIASSPDAPVLPPPAGPVPPTPGGPFADPFAPDPDSSFALPSSLRGPADKQRPAQVSAEAVANYLAGCDGIVYLFDPVIEEREGRSIIAFDETLRRLYDQAAADGRLVGVALPQFLAVCVTKFDDPRIFHLARHNGLIRQDERPPHLPRVPDAHAAEFFQAVCRDSPNQGARVVADGIRAHFREDRVKFFATSSIGFRVDGDRVDLDDHYILNTAGGSERLVDRPSPINILEPLIWAGRGSRRRTS